MDGKEKEVIAVINDGMQKGILKPDQQTYLALAQSYYYSCLLYTSRCVYETD